MIRESVSIVIPAFNEQESLEPVVKKCLRVLAMITGDFEILIVDDGSKDRTGVIADRLARQPKIRVVHHGKNLGFSGAIKTCYQKAKKNLVFILPADGQIDIADIKKYLKKIRNSDIVLGYPLKRGESFIRRFNSFVFHRILCRFLFGIKFRRITTSNLYRREVLDNIQLNSKPTGALIQLELIYKALQMGYRISKVNINYYHRQGGESKGGDWKMVLNTLGELLTFWWQEKISAGLAKDIILAFVAVVMILLIVLFMDKTSQFIYIDF